MKFITLILFWVTFSLSTFAQEEKDILLAQQYYLNAEYEKAVDLYEKLYNKTENVEFYYPLIECYFQIKEFKQAEKVIKKQIKENKKNLAFRVDLGSLYELLNETEKASKEYEKAIDLLEADQQQIFDLAKQFQQNKQFDLGIKTYLKGRDLLNNTYPFNLEIAQLYSQKGDLNNMLNEYLNLLALGDAYLGQVQAILQNFVGDDPEGNKNQLLRAALLKRLQQEPDQTIYNELLVWLFVQERNFDQAFNQLKAIDKRKKEDGSRMMNLAPTALSNENYEVAAKCYEYVISKGKDNYYYTTAKIELVNTLNKKILSTIYTSQDLQQLNNHYLSALAELGKNANSVLLIKNYARFMAFYLHKTDSAMALLNDCIDLAQNNQRLKAECKMELADILVFTGEMWESNLLYSQVELDFKEDPLGQEAKFRNARLSYYRGEFSWAQAQLDVLKASTSKLIANDALHLSLLITENSGLDSITTPLLMFARAELLAYQNKNLEALITLDSINNKFPGHDLSDDILWTKSKIKIEQQLYTEADTLLKQIVTTYAYDLLADDAIFKLAELNEKFFNNNEKAKEYYQKILTDFPSSLYVVEARKKFRKLRGDKIN